MLPHVMLHSGSLKGLPQLMCQPVHHTVNVQPLIHGKANMVSRSIRVSGLDAVALPDTAACHVAGAPGACKQSDCTLKYDGKGLTVLLHRLLQILPGNTPAIAADTSHTNMWLSSLATVTLRSSRYAYHLRYHDTNKAKLICLPCGADNHVSHRI